MVPNSLFLIFKLKEGKNIDKDLANKYKCKKNFFQYTNIKNDVI